MQQYLNLIRSILANGEDRTDRTGVGTKSIFGVQLKFDLTKGFPATTTKKLAWKAVVSELLWFLEGSTSEHRLAELKNDRKAYDQLNEKERKTIWTANYEAQGKSLGYENGYLGPVYGKQWRDFHGVDQIKNAIELIKTQPDSRRIIVNSWCADEIPQMALPPCHTMFQFYVEYPGTASARLDMSVYQRSQDVGLGAPFNYASYALLLSIVARICNMKPHMLIYSVGDTHIYNNHLSELEKLVNKVPLKLPTLKLPQHADYSSIDSFLKSVKVSDFRLSYYNYISEIKIPMAV